MILKQVKQNGIEVMVFITVILLGLAFSMFFPATARHIVEPQNGTPLFDAIYQHLFGGHISIGTQITSLILLLIELFMIIVLNSRFEFTRAKPAMFMIVYIPIALALIPCNTLLPEQIANILIAMGLIKVFTSHGLDKATFAFFDAGLFFGMATLFCLPAAGMLVVGIVAHAIFRPIKGNEFLGFVLGFCTPILFYISVYFLMEGNVSTLWDAVAKRLSATVQVSSRLVLIPLLAQAAIIILASIMMIQEYAKFNVVGSQSYRVMFVMFLMMVILCNIPCFGVQVMRLATLPLAMMYVTVFQGARQTIWLDILFYLFLISYIGAQVFWYI